MVQHVVLNTTYEPLISPRLLWFSPLYVFIQKPFFLSQNIASFIRRGSALYNKHTEVNCLVQKSKCWTGWDRGTFSNASTTWLLAPAQAQASGHLIKTWIVLSDSSILIPLTLIKPSTKNSELGWVHSSRLSSLNSCMNVNTSSWRRMEYGAHIPRSRTSRTCSWTYCNTML